MNYYGLLTGWPLMGDPFPFPGYLPSLFRLEVDHPLVGGDGDSPAEVVNDTVFLVRADTGLVV